MGMTGHCLCGAVGFESATPPIKVMHCHCSMCRRQSGAGFATYAMFHAADVRFHGQPPVLRRSSSVAQRGHCGTCGSPVSFLYDGEPERIYLAAGLFDMPDALSPAEHWHAEGELAWLHLADGLPRLTGQPES
jgi:hypothetical protein